MRDAPDAPIGLLGPILSRDGIKFISAKACHGRDSMRFVEIVCATQADVDAACAWAGRVGMVALIRVGTDEEISEAKRWEEIG